MFDKLNVLNENFLEPIKKECPHRNECLFGSICLGQNEECKPIKKISIKIFNPTPTCA